MIDMKLRNLNIAQMLAISDFLQDDPAFVGYVNGCGESATDNSFSSKPFATPGTTQVATQGQDYAAGLAASVFGKGGQQVDPNVHAQTAATAQLGSGATAQQSTNTAPVGTAGGSMQGGATEELDADGYPWDPRIHPESKAILVKEKTRKLKRAIDPALVAQVRAEWDSKRGNASQTAAPAFNPAATAPVTRFNDQPVNTAQQFQGGATYTPPANNYTPPPLDYMSLSARITGLIAQQAIAGSTVHGLLTHNGVPDLPSLANFPNLWPHIDAEITRLTGGV